MWRGKRSRFGGKRPWETRLKIVLVMKDHSYIIHFPLNRSSQSMGSLHEKWRCNVRTSFTRHPIHKPGRLLFKDLKREKTLCKPQGMTQNYNWTNMKNENNLHNAVPSDLYCNCTTTLEMYSRDRQIYGPTFGQLEEVLCKKENLFILHQHVCMLVCILLLYRPLCSLNIGVGHCKVNAH